MLAPFCIFGGIAVFESISNFIGIKNIEKFSLQALSVFFAVFLLFNSSWIYEITSDEPSGLLNSSVDFPVVYAQQAAGAVWLSKSADAQSIYADVYRSLFFSRYFGERPTRSLPDDPSVMREKSYVFLGNYNIKNHEALFFIDTEPRNPGSILTNRSRIFDNGGAEIYYR